MHPAISYQLAQARMADPRQQAERDALARAARRAGQHGRAGPGWLTLGRRVLAVPGARIDGAGTSAMTGRARLGLASLTRKGTP